ncbi:hypothetical protein Lal_00042407 [Lupinus albus]|nr:hypothetical protein Lal_00042407 [Lupinus albus]
MSNIASKLKASKLELSDDLLAHLVLISLPTQFSQFKISYNCQKDKWSLNELILYCVQEEERMKQEKTESAHLASTSKNVGKKRKFKNTKNEAHKVQCKRSKILAKKLLILNNTRHVKKECTKYHVWREKKVITVIKNSQVSLLENTLYPIILS